MKYIIANWKMNGSIELAHQFINELNPLKTENKIVVCPPAVLIQSFKGFRHGLGAQNCFYEESGAFTGENSPKLLKEIGCQYVLIGHSERRTLFGETSDIVFKKYAAATQQQLIPIICIGEKLEERDRWKEVLKEQLEKYIRGLSSDVQTIFAYEPLWSIGSGVVPTTEEIEKVADFLKNYLCIKVNYPILYGGSVSPNNSAEILNCKGIDGVLVGGASLVLEKFKKIINSHDKIYEKLT